MDDDDGMELNISFTKPVPKPKPVIVKENTASASASASSTTTTTSNTNNSYNNNTNNKKRSFNEPNENVNINIVPNENNIKQNNNINPYNSNNNKNNRQPSGNEYKPKVTKPKEDENAKHRYKKSEEEQPTIQYYSSNVNKYKELEKGKKLDSNYKPKLPTLLPKNTADREEYFGGEETANFGSLKLIAKLSENLTGHMQLQQPTLIQSSAIPPIIDGHDVLVKAQTGSGKTLAYLIPVVNALASRPERINRADGSYCIVVAPTRELSIQIFEVLQKLLKPFHWIVPGLIMGGESRDSEKARLRKGISILVATPGRLLDHLKMTKSFKVDLAKWLVLDEADRLLDLGFEKAIDEIIQLLNEKGSVNRQNLLVSATLSDGIERLAALSLKDPVYVGLDKNDDSNPATGSNDQFNTPKQLDQMYVEVETKERLVTLVAFLKWITTASLMSGNMSKIIIFFSSCDSVEFHHYLFSNVKLEADKTGKNEKKANSIFKDGGTVVGSDGNVVKEEVKKLPIFSATLYKLHGDIEQKQRTETFLNFKKAKEGILLTTDVSARGLDLPAVNWIVQYDPCSDTKDYVHRIGRTARLGQQGSALLFLTPQEKKYVFHLKKFNIEPEEMKVTTILQSLYHTTEGQLKKNMKTTQLESQVHDLQLTLERFILEDGQGLDMARSAYKSSLRAYATHKSNLKFIFHIGSLHLGHVSKSFALRETPTELNKITAKQDKIAKKDEDTKKMKKSTDYKMKNYMETNEFGNGLGSGMANSVDKKRVQTGEFTKSIKRQKQE